MVDASTSTHLTDQASVAVHLGQALAVGEGSRPNVAHLVAGLMGEPEGMAGSFIRQRFGEVAPRIALHPGLTARSLPVLPTAFVALPVLSRPAWTLELLHAARRVGGDDLEFVLTDCGVSLSMIDDDLRPWMPDQHVNDEYSTPVETFGQFSLSGRHFDRAADLAVARTRAQGGDSHTLLRWLDVDEATRNALANAPAVPLDEVIQRAGLSEMRIETSDLVTAVTHLSLRAALRG